MKSASPQLLTHLAGEVTTLAYCWRVARIDGQVFGFTSHDRDLVFDGLTYGASTGFSASALQTDSGLNVDDLEVEGLLESPSITEADLLAGLWDHARVEIFLINWAAPSQGPLKLRVGWIGEVSTKTGQFVAELRGLAQRLQQTVGRSVLAACDADFGDARCSFDLATVTVSGEVTDVASRRIFDGDAIPLRAGGKLTWTSGVNLHRTMEVKIVSGSTIELALPMAYDIAPGDTYSVHAGCDKLFETCRDIYANGPNHRGFPFVPQTDEVIRGPSR